MNALYVDCENQEGPWDGTLEHPFKTINDGLDSAESGDRVILAPCIYREFITLKEGVILSGVEPEETIVDTRGLSGSAWAVKGSDDSSLCKLTIKFDSPVGILCEGESPRIEDNTLLGSEDSIAIDISGSFPLIRSNIIMSAGTGVLIRNGSATFCECRIVN